MIGRSQTPEHHAPLRISFPAVVACNLPGKTAGVGEVAAIASP